MPRFSYNAKALSGEMVQGVRESASAVAVARELAATGMLPIKIEPAPEEVAAEEGGLSWFRKRVTISELVVFSHQMMTLTNAGISVVRAVRSLAESSKNPFFAEVLVDVAGNLEAGGDIASSLGRHPRVFSELYVSLIHVGENTGRLDEAFAQIARYLELERETKRRLQAATRYPSFVLVAIAIAIVVLNIFVIPAFARAAPRDTSQTLRQTRG